MITEDYVSYEIAELLKEKGFNEAIYTYYLWDGSFYLSPIEVNNKNLYAYGYGQVSAPTIQMAMKWLREKHNLIISFKFTIHGWLCDITKIVRDSNGFIININHGIDNDALTYCDECEKSCDMAIRYCLENLI